MPVNLTDLEVMEVKHRVIDRMVTETEWVSEAIREKLEKEKQRVATNQ